MMNWYYAEKGSQVGPISDDEFQSLVKKRTITPNTLVWNSTMKDWQKYGDVVKGGTSDAARLSSEATESSKNMTCVECGNTFPKDDMIQYGDSWVCARCKPVFVQKLKEGVNLPVAMEYAGFWIRFGAKIIDGIIISVINEMIEFAAGFVWISASNPSRTGISFLLQVAVTAAYTTFLLGRYGATIGKMACKLKVVTPEGEPISYLRAFARHFAEWLSALILFIGYIMAAFDEQKRSLHDRICDTRVVRK
ncbi:MAG: RDD family protein [Deltaproteobacteria bacterium]|nr:RDD family protein [Deltaproteobacteria bacterium]